MHEEAQKHYAAQFAELQAQTQAAADIAANVACYEMAWRTSHHAAMRDHYQRLDDLCSTPELRMIRGACVVAVAMTRGPEGAAHVAGFPTVRETIVAEHVAGADITREELGL